MQTIEHLRELIAYNSWANRRIIDALEQYNSARSNQILAHILVTEKEYFERLFGKDSSGFDFWPDISLSDCRRLFDITAKNLEALISDSVDQQLDQMVAYRTSVGVPHENTYRELLTHVVLHSSIHRGNIMLKLRDDDFEPPKIDYIIYLREIKA